MKSKILIFFLAMALPAFGQYVTINAAFSNRTLISSNFVINGVTVTYTNAPLNNSTWIVTNSAAQSATNLQRFIGQNYPSLYARMVSATNVAISGNALQFSFPGNGAAHFASTTTNSAVQTNNTFVTVPFANMVETNRTNIADALIEGIGKYGRTNTFATNSQALTNYVNTGPVPQTFGNKVFTNGTIAGGTGWTNVFTNTIRINVNLAVVTNLTSFGGSQSNATLVNLATASGIVGAVTNGRAQAWRLTNSGGDFRDSYGSNWIFHTATITNLSAPGTGTDSIKVGSGSLAPGNYSVALGNSAWASNQASTAVGYQSIAGGENATVLGTEAQAFPYAATAIGAGAEASAIYSTAIGSTAAATHSNSIAVGWASTTTTTNQIRLGTSAETVSIPGALIVDGGVTMSNVIGSNYVTGRFVYKAGTVTSLVNGNNAGIALGTNQTVELSGGTTIAQIAGFAATGDGDERLLRFTGAVTNWIVNEVNSSFSTDATAANRIVTGTGGDLYLTNQPAYLRVRYRGASSRWEVTSRSN